MRMIFRSWWNIGIFQNGENNPDIPVTGMAVLRQQFALVQALEEWIASIKGKEQADE